MPANSAVRAAILVSALAVIAWGQRGEADVGEANVSTGITFGATGTRPAVAGAIGITLDRYAIMLMECAYAPMGNTTYVKYPGLVANHSGLYSFDLAFQIRVPLRSRWEPYGIIGPVLIFNHYRLQGLYPDGVAYYVGASDVRGGALTGGGVRYYRHWDWGIKGEYRYTISSRNFSSLLVGVFRQF